MRRYAPWIGLLILLACFITVTSADDKTDTKTKSTAKNKKDTKDKKLTGKDLTFVGKLTRVEGAQRYLTVQVIQKIPQENAGAAQNIINLKRQLIGNRDPNSIRNIQAEIYKNQLQLVTYKDQTKDIELQAADDMKVRTMLPPVEYDDKGKRRKLTPKELKEFQGPDPKLKGFIADFDNLKPDQKVEVHLEKPKTVPKSKTKGKGDATAGEKPKVVMIVILEEPVK